MIELNASLIWYLNSGGEVQMSVKMGSGVTEGLFLWISFTLSRSSWSRIDLPLPIALPCSEPRKLISEQHQMANSHYSTGPAHTDGPQEELDWWFIYVGPLAPRGEMIGFIFLKKELAGVNEMRPFSNWWAFLFQPVFCLVGHSSSICRNPALVLVCYGNITHPLSFSLQTSMKTW